jgi:hypothetical protein
VKSLHLPVLAGRCVNRDHIQFHVALDYCKTLGESVVHFEELADLTAVNGDGLVGSQDEVNKTRDRTGLSIIERYGNFQSDRNSPIRRIVQVDVSPFKTDRWRDLLST